MKNSFLVLSAFLLVVTTQNSMADSLEDYLGVYEGTNVEGSCQVEMKMVSGKIIFSFLSGQEVSRSPSFKTRSIQKAINEVKTGGNWESKLKESIFEFSSNYWTVNGYLDTDGKLKSIDLGYTENGGPLGYSIHMELGACRFLTKL